jgi:hypothetical protein
MSTMSATLQVAKDQSIASGHAQNVDHVRAYPACPDRWINQIKYAILTHAMDHFLCSHFHRLLVQD